MQRDETTTIEAAVASLAAAIAAEVAGQLPKPDGPDRLYSVSEASDWTSLGRSRIYELMAAGAIRSFRVGGRRLIPESALREFVEAHDAR